MVKFWSTLKNRDLTAYLVILCLVVIPYWHYLFDSPAPFIYPVSSLGTDLDREVIPIAMTITDQFKTDQTIPLWRSYLLSGSPIAGHPNAPFGYPFYWVLLFLPLSNGFNLVIAIHLILLGSGMYIFLRKGLIILFNQSIHRICVCLFADMVCSFEWWPYRHVDCLRLVSMESIIRNKGIK